MAEWVVHRALIQECWDLDLDQVLFKTITLTTLSWVAWEHQKYVAIFSILWLQNRPRPFCSTSAGCSLPPHHKVPVTNTEHRNNVEVY